MGATGEVAAAAIALLAFLYLLATRALVMEGRAQRQAALMPAVLAAFERLVFGVDQVVAVRNIGPGPALNVELWLEVAEGEGVVDRIRGRPLEHHTRDLRPVRLARVNGLGSGDVHLVLLPTDRVALVLGYGRAAGTIVANYDDVFGNRWTTRLPLGPDPDGASVRPGRATIARR